MGIPATIGQLRTKLSEMNVGDYISFEYTATSGLVGTFANLGSATKADIPVTGTSTPDGKFYLIKVNKGLLIADRVIQISIGYHNLNSGCVAENMVYANCYLPAMTNNMTPPPLKALTDADHPTEKYKAWAAFDKAYNATYFNSSGNCTYLGIDMGVKKEIDFVRILPYPGSYNSGNWRVEGSDDGNNWSLISGNFTIPTTSIWTTVKLNSIFNYRYYRIKRDTFTDQVVIFEIEFYKLSESALIRLLYSGCSYTSENNTFSLTDKGLGAFPISNEFDMYITKSNLNGKITPNDINVWNHDIINNWCKDTPINYIGSASNRVYRKKNTFSQIAANTINSLIGFRPVLEYPDNSKQTILWY